MTRQSYSTDLKDREWAVLVAYIAAPLPGGRPIKWERREIVNAILYVLRTGCAWHLLPHDFPPYQTVFYYFRQWRRSGVWERVNTALREQVRSQMQPEPQPSAAILDPTGMVVTIVKASKRRKKGATWL
jgi:putative transposase